jgi:hypothetical protein
MLLDRQVNVSLSQGDGALPLSGNCFNLRSPYPKNALLKTMQRLVKKPWKPDTRIARLKVYRSRTSSPACASPLTMSATV